MQVREIHCSSEIGFVVLPAGGTFAAVRIGGNIRVFDPAGKRFDVYPHKPSCTCDIFAKDGNCVHNEIATALKLKEDAVT